MRLTKTCCSIVALLVCVLVGSSASAQSCTPIPKEFIGAGGGFEYIANGQPLSTNCWTITGNAPLVTTPGCTYWTAKAFDMHYGARIRQEFTVPAERTETHWGLSYLLTMQDPHDDGWWNRIKATVYDANTGQTIVSQTYWGDDPDVTCQNMVLTFNGNYANRRLGVVFSDGSAYTDTVIRVRSISLIQSY